MAIKIDKVAATWLLLWTLNNIGLTLLNKAVFSKVSFPYPFLLSSVHMMCNSVGSQVLTRVYRVESYPQTNKAYLFSLIFSLNIAVGNLSLQFVSVNFNQMMRSLVPAITILLGRLVYQQRTSSRRIRAVIPVLVGVALATLGDVSHISARGFLVTCACICFAALKVVAAGELVRELPPLELLRQMAPMALLQCLIMSFLNGELKGVNLNGITAKAWRVVIVSGMVSFTLNICSLQANKVTSPLTLCIAANAKQVLMIAIGTTLFNTHITTLNGFGIIIVLMASANYSLVSLKERTTKSSNKDNILPTTILPPRIKPKISVEQPFTKTTI